MKNKGWIAPEVPFSTELSQSVYEKDGDAWERTFRAYEAHPNDPYLAWRFLNNHPLFWSLTVFKPASEQPTIYVDTDKGFDCIDTLMTRFNPKTKQHDSDSARNTQTQVWLEGGHRAWTGEVEPTRYHDVKLDVGAKTYEKAVVKMAKLVHQRYGNDRTKLSSKEGREPLWSVITPNYKIGAKGKHAKTTL